MSVRVMFSVKYSNLRRYILRNVTYSNFNGIAYFSEKSNASNKRAQTESALYVSGNKATSTFSVLSPYLDFTKRFQDIAVLERNIKMRGLDTNVQELAQMWAKLKEMELRKEQLETERTSIAKFMKDLAKSKEKNREEIQEYKKQGKEVREQLKSITQEIWDLEEKAVIGALRLPNILHQSTKEYDKELFKLFKKPSCDFSARNHVELGKINQELEFLDVSPSAYYLKKGLAILELGCIDYFVKIFKSHEYLLHSNPDFAKAVVVEGCGVKINNKVFALASHESDTDSNLQFLVGGASLQAFAAYFTKQVITNPECLPQKLITAGRHYSPPIDSASSSLFNAGQSTVINGVLLYHSHMDEELLLNEVLMALVQSYSRLNLHFRLIQYSSNKLEPQECAAIGLEMFSPCTEEYHEIGRVSLYGDFISQRLLSLYKTGSGSAKFLSMIHVKVCHVARLLAIIMENGQNENGTYEIPKSLKTICETL